MNKYQEALNHLKDETIENFKKKHIPTYEERTKIINDVVFLQELVDKATPKKPEITIYNGFCPNCHQAFGFERTRQAMLRPYWLSFCPVCGQALDWRE